MKPLPADDYSRYKTTPVTHESWNSRTKLVARDVIKQLGKILEPLDVDIRHMGSTALEIAGKNEIEVYIFPASGDWETVFHRLRETYGDPGYTDQDFIRFDGQAGGFELEIIQLRGYVAKVNKALYQYLADHPQLCQEYEALKKRYSFSKREYQIHKEQFFDRVVQQIPEDYVT